MLLFGTLPVGTIFWTTDRTFRLAHPVVFVILATVVIVVPPTSPAYKEVGHLGRPHLFTGVELDITRSNVAMIFCVVNITHTIGLILTLGNTIRTIQIQNLGTLAKRIGEIVLGVRLVFGISCSIATYIKARILQRFVNTIVFIIRETPRDPMLVESQLRYD